MLQNFTDTSIKIHIEDVQSSIAFRISLVFFLKKKNLTETRKITIDKPNLSADEPAVVNCS